jgi:hypothetical protein
VSTADLILEKQQAARAYIGLQTARLRNPTTEKATLDVDAALTNLGVLQPRPDPRWHCAFDCGFSTDKQAELQEHQEQCSTDEDGFSRSWDTGKWQCDYCDFEFDDADFTQDLSDEHRKACLYRRNSGSPFQCKDCNVPVSVKKEHLLHYRTYPHMYRLKCQDCQGWTADASVQTDLPVRDKKQNKGKGSGQQEGQAKKEGPSSRSMAW